MRILLTADPELPVPPGNYGGIERLVDMWARELRALGHSVALCAHPASTAKVDRFFPWPGRASPNRLDTLRNTVALSRAVRAFQPDIVHSSSRLIYTIPQIIGKQPTVMTYHRLPSQRQVTLGARIGGNRLTFTGVSEFISRLGAQAGGFWQTVPNCIEIEAYTCREHVPDDAPLVFLSRIEEVKGVREAIEIAQAAKKRLIIAGNHSADANAARYWQEKILPRIDGENVSYVGTVNDEEKNNLLGSAAAMLLPVNWDEPFGMVAVESFACGTPVLTSPRGGLKEIIEDGITGFFCHDVASAVDRVAQIPTLSRIECRRSAELRYTPMAAVSSFLDVYQSAITRSASPGTS